MTKPVGRPPHVPTLESRAQVERMAAVGITHEQIGLFLGITSVETLKKYYRKELDEAKTKADVAVAGALYKSAIKGNVSAQIFWCKTRLGWRETTNIEHEGGINLNFLTPLVSNKLIDDKKE